MKAIDLNVDIGEGFDFDSDLLLYASSANICCGVHAGSWNLTQETIGLALDSGVRIGMHPGYPDRASMGRSALPKGCEKEFRDSILQQSEAFFNFVPPAYIKPHGAFYVESQRQEEPAFEILCELVSEIGLPIMGLPGTAHELLPSMIVEGYADRGYTPQGTLITRGQPGALLASLSEVQQQALLLAERVESICIHGDTPYCVELAEAVYSALLDHGYEVTA